jgi:chaperone modulatory protein CbpM
MSERDVEMVFTLEEIARFCAVERAWVIAHMDDGLLSDPFTPAVLIRARRMRQLERDFDAVPELAALFADLLEELDALRAQHRKRS